ncbi:aminotransferase A [Bacillus sp. FSL W8-0116]|uniref:aminotransferase A n=1 Tax=Bacillus sp. FSL W8-0116 TaxID=2978206 RepID=UPI0030F54ABE
MEQYLNENVKNIQISGIRKFFNMVSGIEGMISLTIGQPDFPTPDHIKKAGMNAIQKNFTVYTHNAGYLPLRQAISHYVHKKYNLTYSPESEIIVTIGASEAIDVALRTILCPGDEVILPGPVYPGYEPIIRMCQGVPVFADTRDNQFKLTKDVLEKYVTANTKCVILPYPSNPTGVSLTEDELKEIALFLKDKPIFVIADEIYSELLYDRPHVSIGRFLREQTIVINGLSKSHSMTGWRIGFLMALENIAQHLLKVHQYNVSCASSISQMAALEAYTNGEEASAAMREEYKKRRAYVYERLESFGLEVVRPDGAFYFFVKIPDAIKLDSFDFCLQLAREQKVALVPGSAFSHYGEGYFRLSYAASMKELEEGLNRLENFLKSKHIL